MPAYTTRAVVKTYLGIPSATSSEDDPIDAAIDAAEAELAKAESDLEAFGALGGADPAG